MIKQQGGKQVDLNEENLKLLINIYSVFQEKSNYRLSEEEVLEFSKELTKNNSLLLEILKPSGHIEPYIRRIIDDFTKPDETNHKPDETNHKPDETNHKPDETNHKPDRNKHKKLISDFTKPDEMNLEKEKNIAFLFNGSKYEVSSWKELLITVCNLMNNSHKREFDKVLTLKGRTRSLFSNDPSQLKRSEQIQGTNIYVEINLSSDQIMKNVKKIIDLFGYPEDSISFEIKGEN
jgi:hypothetical protein